MAIVTRDFVSFTQHCDGKMGTTEIVNIIIYYFCDGYSYDFNKGETVGESVTVYN